MDKGGEAGIAQDLTDTAQRPERAEQRAVRAVRSLRSVSTGGLSAALTGSFRSA